LPYPTQIDATLSEYHVDIPSEVPSGFVRLSATNNGGMVHYLLLARIHDGMSYDEWAQTFHDNEFAAEGMVDFYGGPNGVGLRRAEPRPWHLCGSVPDSRGRR